MGGRNSPNKAPSSCTHCFGWGQLPGSKCRPCFRFGYYNPVGTCGGCARTMPVSKGFCRLCWVCAGERLRGTPHWGLAPHMENTRHHQLFFAHMQRPRKTDRRPRTSRPRTYEQRLPPLAIPKLSGISGVQLRLFDLPRDYSRVKLPALIGRRYFHFESDNPWLNWAFHAAQDLAEHRGWPKQSLTEVNVGLVIALSTNPHGEPVRHSELFPALRARRLPVERTVDVLDKIGLLDDDRIAAHDRWLDRKLTPLTAGIRRDVHAWHQLLRNGGPRSRPRSINTAREYLNTLQDILTGWSQRYPHLREVTHDDILDALDGAEPLQGNKRARTLTALRSLFGYCKRTNTIFRDPTTKIPTARPHYHAIVPLQPDDISQALDKATKPLPRLILALAGIHAARTGTIRNLQLDDVDIANRRITIAGVTRPLDDLTHQVIRSWLDHRSTLWPHTSNPHLIISRQTAMKTTPVTSSWLNRPVRGLAATIERLRQDRQLDEALASGADPLHLTAVFGVAPTTAVRYATAARQLADNPDATDKIAGNFSSRIDP